MIRLASAIALTAAFSAQVALAEGWLLDAPALRELQPKDLAERPAQFPFPVGEKLAYRVSYFGIPAGSATLEIARFVAVGERRYAHVVATARTNDFFTHIYRVDDRSEAWIDLDRFVTEFTATEERHGRKHYREEVRFDWDTHFVHFREDRLHQSKRREVSFDFGEFARDGFDLAYALRALPVGVAVTVPTYASRKIYAFRVEPAGEREIANERLGAIRAHGLRPLTRLDDRPYSAGKGTIWLASSLANAPVRLEGWVRTDGAGFLLQGLRIELVERRAAAPGWPSARLPSLVAEPVALDTVMGRPRWIPPPEVRAARAAAGVVERDVTSDLATRVRVPASASRPRRARASRGA